MPSFNLKLNRRDRARLDQLQQDHPEVSISAELRPALYDLFDRYGITDQAEQPHALSA